MIPSSANTPDRVANRPLLRNGVVYPHGMNYKALPANQEHDVTLIVDCLRY